MNKGRGGRIKDMKIAILGAGALGSYYGARLAEAGHDVCFIMRSAYDAVAQNGLHINSIHGNLHLRAPHIARTPVACGPVDLVIVCWKATCNHLLQQALPPLLHKGTEVLTLQNGMGNAEAIARVVAPQHVFVGLCFVCAMMNEPGVIEHSEKGDIQMAPYINGENGLCRAQQLAALFEGTPVNTSCFEHAERILWCKLSWNIPFNGLCLAHGGISIKQLFTMPEEVERARRIMQEVCHTAEQRGYPLPQEIVLQQMESTAGMGNFIPSSAVDYNRHRPVEYEAIWGTPLRLALAANAQVPEWVRLAADIRTRLSIA